MQNRLLKPNVICGICFSSEVIHTVHVPKTNGDVTSVRQYFCDNCYNKEFADIALPSMGIYAQHISHRNKVRYIDNHQLNKSQTVKDRLRARLESRANDY